MVGGLAVVSGSSLNLAIRPLPILAISKSLRSVLGFGLIIRLGAEAGAGVTCARWHVY